MIDIQNLICKSGIDYLAGLDLKAVMISLPMKTGLVVVYSIQSTKHLLKVTSKDTFNYIAIEREDIGRPSGYSNTKL